MNDIEGRVAAGVITAVVREALKGLAQADGWLRGKTKEQDPLGVALRRYEKRFERRYNLIRIFGMEKPIPLKKIYVRTNILRKITSHQRISIAELRDQFGCDIRGYGSKREIKTGKEVVNELQHFILLGKPGSGKTTFLRFVALLCLGGELKSKRIPILVSLKEWIDSDDSLIDYIVDEFDICNFPDAKAFIIRILEKGKCQLLFDGLDEIPKRKQQFAIKHIHNFSNKYIDNHFIVSCRIAAYNHWFPQYTDVEIADFNEKQVRRFISNWFDDQDQTAKLCWEKLRKSERLKELTTIPLLLTLLCLAFEELKDFPKSRAETYREGIDALLKKWDDSKNIKRDEIYRLLSLERKEIMFSRIAKETFEKDQYFFSQHTLESKLAHYLQDLPDFKEPIAMLDKAAILKAIEVQHGIFTERAKRIYSFSHLTFQEYFTAKYLTDNAKFGSLEWLIQNQITNERWREVFLLTTELVGETDDFLLKMKTQIDTKGAEISLNDFLLEILDIDYDYYDHNYPPAIVITLSIAYTYYNLYSREFDEDSEMETYYENDVVHQVIFDMKLDREELSPYAKRHQRDSKLYFRLYEVSCELACYLDRNGLGLLRISQLDNLTKDDESGYAAALTRDFEDATGALFPQKKEDIVQQAHVYFHDEKLLSYLTANRLLLECIDTECRVSERTKSTITETLFDLKSFDEDDFL